MDSDSTLEELKPDIPQERDVSILINLQRELGSFLKSRSLSVESEINVSSESLQSGQTLSQEEMIPDGGLTDEHHLFGLSGHEGRSNSIDRGQLISPKKPPHSAKEIPELKDLHRELAFNNKMGINVLGQKSELKRAMEKMRDQVVRKREEEEKKHNKSDLEAELEKRALRLKEIENVLSERNGGPFPNSEDEFHRIHAKVNGRFASATS